MGELDGELDRLYGLPLDEFTGARNELARELKKAGDPERATDVAALKKPTASAWVLNQLARRQATLVQRLLDAGDALRSAQERALGGGHADELRQAAAAERDAVRDLAQAARDLADESGKRISEPVLARVRTSLSAVAGNEEARDLLSRGRATTDFERSGFPALAAAPAVRPAPKSSRPAGPSGRDELAERRQRRAERERHVRELRRQLRELKREAAQADREAQRTEQKATQARAEADRAEQAHRQAIARATALAAEVDRVEAELARTETDK